MPDEAVREQHQALEEAATASPYFRNFNPRFLSLWDRRHFAPRLYLDEVGIERIGELIHHGFSLGRICELLDISTRIMRKWIAESAVRMQEIEDARAWRASEEVDEAQTLLAEHPDLDRAKAISDFIKWKAEKWDRELYGKQMKVEGTINHGVSYNITLNPKKRDEALAGVFKRVNALPLPEEAPSVLDEEILESVTPEIEAELLDFSKDAEEGEE